MAKRSAQKRRTRERKARQEAALIAVNNYYRDKIMFRGVKPVTWDRLSPMQKQRLMEQFEWV